MKELVQAQLKMTSREIATLTEKRHSDVMRDIERMYEQLNEEVHGCEQKFVHPQNGQEYREYALDREHTECLVTGYSALLRMKVIKRLRELEEINQPKLPQTLPEALRLAADLAEQNQQMSQKMAVDAPKVDFADRVEKSSGVLIGDFAKAVGTGERRLFAWLRANGYLISTAGRRHNTPYQQYVDNGYFDVTERTYEMPDGEVKASFTTHITGKGQIAVTKKLKECGMIGEVAK